MASKKTLEFQKPRPKAEPPLEVKLFIANHIGKPNLKKEQDHKDQWKNKGNTRGKFNRFKNPKLRQIWDSWFATKSRP